ncbi:MAG: 16S rRNA (cytidine(1402)-2'-O)-methyltransferase [Archangium sp.]|nr:16S rRNA (cytidine(1402)-2'-O)-methyltransferase [Archangium sp.]MDP3155430.1 16S rRNA (cytidine(1402)-2'-O)-methyltransferase [Archangium sp.]MDP3573762.1 16S rRNA (cytidine(1402)-2'-O)-methyltransferase [Archangium sp.]
MPGRLFVVATPIGNLNDLSPRAIETLRAVSVIACEDTRHTRGLLEKFGIATPTVSLPAFAEGQRAGAILERLLAGADVALVTDAGTPAISDPGEKLVLEAVAAGVTIIPIPGPAAFVAALSAGGLPTGRFHFLGFLPRQVSEAKAMIDEVSQLSATLVLYESPRRLVDTLESLAEWLGPRRAVVARELTKLHEEFGRGTLLELAEQYGAGEVLGEVVVLVEGRTGETRWSEDEVRRALTAALAAGERLKGLSTDLAKRSGWSAQELYRIGLGLK